MSLIAESEPPAAVGPPDRAGLRSALFAPWLACASPGRGARRLASASTPALMATFAIQALWLVLVIVALVMFEAVLVIQSKSPVRAIPTPARAIGTSLPTTVFTRYVVDEPGVTVSWRSPDAVWPEWHPPGRIGQPLFILLMTACLLPPVVLLGTGLHLCTVHRGGRLGPSVRRAFAAIVAASGPLIALAALAGGAAVLADELTIPIDQGALWMPVPGEFLVMASIALGASLLLGATGRAAAAAEAPADALAIPPRCEQCGYDLTETPRDGRCPECGLDARHSLEGELYRRGVPWERHRDVRSWLETGWLVLFQPRAFYRRLRLRGGDGSVAFRRIQFGVLPPVAFGWFLLTFVVGEGWESDLPVIAAVTSLDIALLAWLVYRVAAAIATVPWLFGDSLPDFRWARRVMGYESAFLWAFCGFNGAMVSLTLIFDDFGDWLFRTRAFFQLPLWPTLLLFGNLGLGLIWIWRYQVALRAVRWSNH